MSTVTMLGQTGLKTPPIPDEEAVGITDAKWRALPTVAPLWLAGYVPRKKLTDLEGREWGLGKDAKGQWVRFRYFKYDNIAECEMADGHLLKPERWPVKDETVHFGPGLVATKPGAMSVECEHCGGHVLVTNEMATDPPKGIRLVIPEAKKK